MRLALGAELREPACHSLQPLQPARALGTADSPRAGIPPIRVVRTRDRAQRAGGKRVSAGLGCPDCCRLGGCHTSRAPFKMPASLARGRFLKPEALSS